jgi:hypothetical protein
MNTSQIKSVDLNDSAVNPTKDSDSFIFTGKDSEI